MALNDLSDLSLDELNRLIAEATKMRDRKIEEKRGELLKQLADLDALSGKPVKSASTQQGRAPARHDMFEGEEGEQWSGRGGIPRWAKEKYGVTDRVGMERFRKYKKD